MTPTPPRIIAGAAGGTVLASPPASDITRPTTDRTKEAVFSWLESRGWLEPGTRVLDLFAGSGSLGLEAASRGVGEVALIERHRPTAATASRNAKTVTKVMGSSAPRITVHTQSAEAFLAQDTAGGWDLILADPPYDLEGAELTGILAAATKALVSDGMIVLERSVRTPDPDFSAGEPVELIDDRSYGESRIIFARRIPDAPAE